MLDTQQAGFRKVFVVRLDGKPTRKSARYFVIDYSGADPHAIKAIHCYAKSVMDENPELSKDLMAAIADPKNAPGAASVRRLKMITHKTGVRLFGMALLLILLRLLWAK